jgi:hypothetical protein
LLIVANFVDDVGPVVSQRMREMFQHEHGDLSLTSLIQAQRVLLDTVKLLDRGEKYDEALGTLTRSGRSFLVKELLKKTLNE